MIENTPFCKNLWPQNPKVLKFLRNGIMDGSQCSLRPACVPTSKALFESVLHRALRRKMCYDEEIGSNAANLTGALQTGVPQG